MNQTGHRLPNYHYDFLLVKFWLWKMLWSFVVIWSMSQSSPIIIKNPFFIARYNSFEKINHFYCAKEGQMIFQNNDFFLCSFNLVAAPNQASNLSSFFVFPIFLNGYKLLYALHSIQKQTSERLYEDWLQLKSSSQCCQYLIANFIVLIVFKAFVIKIF